MKNQAPPLKKRSLLLLLLFCYAFSSAKAGDRIDKKQSFSLHAGYSHMFIGSQGLTNSSTGYRNNLSNGISWDGQYYFYPMKWFGPGLFYSGFSSKNSHEFGSDHLYTHYIAPQFSAFFLMQERFRLRGNIGLGYMVYRNNSLVYEKDRTVKGDRIAFNTGIVGEYLFNEHWGFSFDLQGVFSSLRKAHINYHDEKITVRYKEDNRLKMSRINISLGLVCYF